MELTAQKGKGDREKRTSDCARTRDLHSIAEFQPHEPRRPVEIPRPPLPLCTGHRCAAIQRRLRPVPLSITEFQPHEPWRPVEILLSLSLLCTGHRCVAIQRHLDLRLEAGTVCYVMVAGSAVPSTLHEVASLRWKATSLHVQ